MIRSFLTSLLHRLRGGAGTAEAPGTPGTPLALQGGMAQDATVARPGATTGLVPFDENLLERARTQWQFGDWASLAALSRETLQHHPDRAKLALLAAAGHQQVGDGAAARQFTRLAQDWGCNKRLVAQILLAGAHNTIARAAAAAGQVPRALKHFQASVATGMPGTDVALASRARVAHQVELLGFSNGLTALEAPSLQGQHTPWTGQAGVATALPETAAISALALELKQQQIEMAKQGKTHQDELIKVRKHLEWVLKKEVLNSTKQLEAFMSVQHALSGGGVLLEMHGWPISPDLAAYLIDLLRTNDYDLVIEFGSGTSTVVMAKALAQMSRRREGRPPVVQIAFEHLEVYHAQTQDQLKAAGLADAATVHLAPMAPYQSENGKSYPYYTCEPALQALKARFDKPDCSVLVLVDGPPGSTGVHARYPAVGVVTAALSQVALDVVLDDFIREDEQQVASMWQDDLKAAGRETTTEVRKMEKDAFLIRVKRRTRRTAHV